MPVYTAAAFRDQAVTAQAGGSATNPTANAVIATVAIPSAGLWEITVYAFLSGTIAAGDLSNMQVRQNATVRFNALPLPAVAATTSSVPPFTMVVKCSVNDTVSVNAVGAASGAAAVYNAGLVARLIG